MEPASVSVAQRLYVWYGDWFDARPKLCNIAQDLKSSPTSGMSDICATLIVCVGGMLYPQTGATLSCTVRPSRQR